MSESKSSTTTCNFCHGAESYGEYAEEVHKMFWYMAHSPMVKLHLLERFQQYLAENSIYILPHLKVVGKSYPGMEEK